MNGNDMLNKLIRVEHNIIQEYYKLIMNEMDNRDYNISFTCICALRQGIQNEDEILKDLDLDKIIQILEVFPMDKIQIDEYSRAYMAICDRNIELFFLDDLGTDMNIAYLYLKNIISSDFGIKYKLDDWFLRVFDQDFKKYNPHIYVASIGTLQQFYRDNFKVVGFHVSQRPYAQQAMALDVENLAKVKSMFTKIKLPQNEYFSVGIYNSFKKGYSLFVPDQLGVYANRIKTENVLYENLIEQYFRIFKIKNSIIDDLAKNGYKITKDKFDITKQEVESMHIEINNIIKPLIAEKIGYRKISFPK